MPGCRNDREQGRRSRSRCLGLRVLLGGGTVRQGPHRQWKSIALPACDVEDDHVLLERYRCGSTRPSAYPRRLGRPQAPLSLDGVAAGCAVRTAQAWRDIHRTRLVAHADAPAAPVPGCRNDRRLSGKPGRQPHRKATLPKGFVYAPGRSGTQVTVEYSPLSLVSRFERSWAVVAPTGSPSGRVESPVIVGDSLPRRGVGIEPTNRGATTACRF